MRVAEVMSEGVITVSPMTPAVEAWDLMQRQRIHHLVVTRAKTIVGVLSAGDAGGRAGAPVRTGRTAGDLMSSGVVTVGLTDTVRSVANLLRGRRIGCVPVVDGERLVGIVTVSDLLEALGRGVDRPSARTRPIATHRVPHRKTARGGAPW